MALTANTLPAIPPGFIVPFDAMLDLSGGVQTLTATGYMGSPNTVNLPVGRLSGILALDISAIDVSSGDETYKFCLFGSNDVSFGNGNVELLAFHDFAAASAGRQVPTILGASPAMPPVGAAGTLTYVLFSNLMQRIVYQYARGYVVIGGTTPSVSFRAWLSPFEMKV
jgi:hypothetical protein